MFLTLNSCLKLVVGNTLNFFPPFGFLVGLGNFWTPIKGTWQSFLPRIACLCLSFPWFVLVLGGFSKLIQPCLIAFPLSTFFSACRNHSVWVCFVANVSCWMGLMSIKSGVWMHGKYLQPESAVAEAPQVKKTSFRFLAVLLTRFAGVCLYH